MKSLLSALDEGRLVELPDTDKEKTLEYLALLIEAIPGIAQRNDIVQEVKKRESFRQYRHRQGHCLSACPPGGRGRPALRHRLVAAGHRLRCA